MGHLGEWPEGHGIQLTRSPGAIRGGGQYAFLTSGYGSTIDKAAVATGALLARTQAPYGSFELDAAHGVIASSSLLRGTVAIYETNLRLMRVVRLAPAARDLAISAR